MLALMSMNRQLRRAQEKQEKKLEKERDERKAERSRRLNQYRAERDRARAQRERARKAAKGGNAPRKAAAAPAGNRTADPGRFSGALTIATVFFILIQSSPPVEAESLFDSFVKAGFYLALGYFLHLWLRRRGLPRAFILTVTAGAMVLTGTWLGHLLRPSAPLDALGMLLSLPFLVLGTWLGQLVIDRKSTRLNSS